MSGTPPAEVQVDAALVASLVAEQHPQYAQLPIRFFGEGWDNFTFRLGDDLAVRLPRRKAAADLLLNELRWLPELEERLPLHIPAPVAHGVARLGYPWTWTIVHWIAGEPSDLAPPDADQGPVLARFLRALHQRADADAPRNPYRGVPLADRAEAMDARLRNVREHSDLITPVIERLWSEALQAAHATERVWLHGDLHAQNVLTRAGALAGVIDWGDVCAGDAATDLAAIWGLLPDRSAREAAITAYAPDAALLARAKGWAVLFGATLYDAGRVSDPRHKAIGEATLRRLAEDFS